MSVHVSAYVWEYSTHKGTELLLMLALADIAHKNGVAFPSVATLARFIRMSERNTQRVLQKLESSGELKIKTNAGPKGTHVYQVVLNTTLPLFEKGGDILSGDNLAPPVKLSPDKLPGDTRGQKGVTKTEKGGDTVMSPEPVEPKENRKAKGASRARFPRPGEDYSPPPDVVRWVEEKGYSPFLALHVEKFRLACKVQRRTPYADLDAAFQNCVLDDWGHVRMQAQREARFSGQTPLTTQAKKRCRYCPKAATGHVGGVNYCDTPGHMTRAMDGEPAPEKVTS